MNANNTSGNTSPTRALTIGADQMAEIEQASVHEFEDRMWILLQKFYPDDCNEFGEAEIREIIRAGIDVAETYGITMEPDVAEYIVLLFRGGFELDVDPASAWAGEILRDERLSPSEKLTRISDRLDREEENL